MLIYRLEVANNGPYRDFDSSAKWYKSMLSDHANYYTHPGIHEDVNDWYELKDRYDYYCAFDTKEKLIKWFSYYLFGFSSINAEVVTYETNSVIASKSNKQVIFKLFEADEVSRQPLINWLVDNTIGLNKLIKLKRLCNKQCNFFNTPIEVINYLFLHYELAVDTDTLLEKLNFISDNNLATIKTAGDCAKYIILINEIERLNT